MKTNNVGDRQLCKGLVGIGDCLFDNSLLLILMAYAETNLVLIQLFLSWFSLKFRDWFIDGLV